MSLAALPAPPPRELEGPVALEALPASAHAVVRLPAPVAPLWAALPDAEAEVFLVAPEDGPRKVGWGRAWRAVAEGPDRLARLEREVDVMARRFADGPAPSIFVGLSFEDEVDAEWRAFGAAAALLPRLTYVVDGPRAWLEVVVEPGASRAALAQEAQAARARLVEARPPEPLRLTARAQGDRARWAEGIQAAQAAMAAQAVKKVVLSRRIPLEAPTAPSPRAVAAALFAAPSPGTRFLACVEGASFFGVTPERLVRVEGTEVRSAALAGSRPAGQPAAGLLEDPKELEEHAYVRRHVVERLEGFGATVQASERPELLELGYVSHLYTPIHARLARPASALAVAAALHPTPAVGGVPLDEARRHIRAAEGRGRGWYTGAVGALGPNGAGELWVALRAARLDGLTGHAYVGAGIVRGSDPDREWVETEAKANAVLGALGAR